jgi:hypothetical protein
MDEEPKTIDMLLGIAMGAGTGLLVSAVAIAASVYFLPDSFGALPAYFRLRLS